MKDAIDIKALKENFNRDGFIVLRDYLSSLEVSELRDHAKPLVERLIQSRQNTDHSTNLLKSLHRHDNWLQSQLDNGRHVPLVQQLAEMELRGCSVAWFDRSDGEITGVPPHFDVLRGQGSINAGVTVWVALDLVNKNNGCLHYLRGSHKEIYPDQIFVEGVEIDAEDVSQVEVKPGDVVIHNALTLHWSGGNISGMPRRAVSYFYRNF